MESAFSLFPLAHFCKSNAPNGTKAINIQMLLRLARVGGSGHGEAVVDAEGGSDSDFGGGGNGDASDAGGDLVSLFFATV